MTTTPRIGLPLMTSYQAGKDITYNEALALTDGLLLAVAQSRTTVQPPANPMPGDLWIIPANAAAAWAGRGGYLSLWTHGGWRYVLPREGMRLWLLDEAVEVRVIGGLWIGGDVRGASLTIGGVQVVGQRQDDVAEPTGGTVIDEQARATLSSLLARLRSHGLIG